MTDEVVVRDGRPEDIPLILAMIQELATYEGLPDGPRLSVHELMRDGFPTAESGASTWFFLVVAERGGRLEGYALCNRAYSSWTGRALYMEDLYVREGARGAGLGAKLVRAACARGAREGATRMDWHVLESNHQARRFYTRLGAVDIREKEGRAALRLYQEDLKRLADQHERGAGDVTR